MGVGRPTLPFDNRELFPLTADVNAQDHLTIGDCDSSVRQTPTGYN